MTARATSAQSRAGTGRTPEVNPFEGPFTVKRLAAAVSADLGLPVEMVISPDRHRKYALARGIVAHFARKKGHTFAQIGRAFNRDHSTIVHAVQNLPYWLGLYTEYAATFDRYTALYEHATKGHHAHVIAWRAHQAPPPPVVKIAERVPDKVVSFASSAELARFRAVRANLEQDERNRRAGSAKLSEALARVGGWR
jgi:hypothetical protein